MATTVEIAPELTAFVEAQVRGGAFANAGEVVSAGLRRLADYERKVAELRQALIEGEESGVAEDFDFEAFLQRKREQHSLAA